MAALQATSKNVHAAAPDQVRPVGDGFDVQASLPEDFGDLLRQLLVKKSFHPRRACSPAAAAASPRSYSASLTSISRSISSLYSP